MGEDGNYRAQRIAHLAPAGLRRALAALGLDLLIELIAAAGFYTLVAMTLNAFDVPVPGGKRPLP